MCAQSTPCTFPSILTSGSRGILYHQSCDILPLLSVTRVWVKVQPSILQEIAGSLVKSKAAFFGSWKKCAFRPKTDTNSRPKIIKNSENLCLENSWKPPIHKVKLSVLIHIREVQH